MRLNITRTPKRVMVYPKGRNRTRQFTGAPNDILWSTPVMPLCACSGRKPFSFVSFALRTDSLDVLRPCWLLVFHCSAGAETLITCVCKGGCNLVYEIGLWLQNRHRMILLQEPLDPCLLIACIFRPNATWNMFRWLC